MHISFSELPSNAKIWIYQSDKPLTAAQQEKIDFILTNFTNSWDAHGAPLKASFQILHSIFIVIGVDQDYNASSGCSIDKSLHIIQHIQNELELNLLDRLVLSYENNNGVALTKSTFIKDLIAKNEIKKDTFVFNNLINSKNELETSWKVKATESWIARYFA